MTAQLNAEKKKAAPVERDGQTSTTWKGSKMQRQLNSDDLLVAIEELCEFHGCPETKPMCTPADSGGWLLTLAVTDSFTSVPNVYRGSARTIIAVRGEVLRGTLEALHGVILAAAPSYEIQRGA